MTEATQTARPLYEIAAEIRHAWPKVSPYAEPYLDAMDELTLITDRYYLDSAAEIVMRFLVNASGWRGEDARRIKAELRSMSQPSRRPRG